MNYPTITKTYTLEPPTEKDTCYAHVMVYRSLYDSEETCGAAAIQVLSIKTITVRGKLIHNRQGFCNKHWKRKYARWFKTDVVYPPDPVRPMPYT